MKWYIILLLLQLYACKEQTWKMPEGISQLPKFDLLLTDSTTVLSTAQLRKDAPVIFFYFDPYCHTCQEETEMLTQNIKQLGDTQILFMGIVSTTELKDFVRRYALDRYPTIKVVKDHEYSLINTFKLKAIPSMVCYNKKGDLVKVFEGGAKMEDIKKSLRL